MSGKKRRREENDDKGKEKKKVRFSNVVEVSTYSDTFPNEKVKGFQKRKKNDEGEEDLTVIEKDGEVPLEPFNLSTERREGYFDNSGYYIRRREREEVDDVWADSLRVVDSTAEDEDDQSENEEESEEVDHVDINDLKEQVCVILEDGDETPSEALRERLDPSKDKQEFELLTELCDSCVSSGFFDVFTTSKREMAPKWDLKWNGQEELHGPYSSEEMHVWKNAGYFSENGEVRRHGKTEFQRANGVDFSQFT